MPRSPKKTSGNSGDDSNRASGEGVKPGGWTDKDSPLVWKTFPGPRGIEEPVRVCISRDAYADLISHAKQSLDVEVCGVLIGDFCEDDEGEYVSVEAVIQGEAAKAGGAHVTFTQETWNRIHDRRESEHPKRDIVGWYHTHPGFGVQFSEMDLFIQRNFFAQRNQVALVTDPLGGEEAVCVNTADGIAYLSRFWVEGRERTCCVPASCQGKTTTHATEQSEQGAARLQAIEDRISQLIAVVEEQRTSLYRFLLTLGIVACVGMVLLIGYNVYRTATSDLMPPETMRYAEIPVRVGDETYFLGVQVVKWKAPDQVWNGLMNAVKEAMAAEEAARQKAEEEARMKKEGGQPADSTAKGQNAGSDKP